MFEDGVVLKIRSLVVEWRGRCSRSAILIVLLASPLPAWGDDHLPILDAVTKGQLLLEAGDTAAASVLCQRALRGARRSEALTCLGEVELARGNIEHAAALGNRALKLRGTRAVRLLLGRAYLQLGMCAEAAPHFTQVLVVDPDHRQALEGLVACAKPETQLTARKP